MMAFRLEQFLAGHQLDPFVSDAVANDPRRIVVTGASGWLGMATLDLLRRALGASFADRVRCYGSSHRILHLADGTAVTQAPLYTLGLLDRQATLVLHLAFLTKDRATAVTEAAYVAATSAISDQVASALDGIGADAIFVPSSGAATKVEDPATSPAMRLYGQLKRRDEALFAGWAGKRGAAGAIVRVFNLSGPYINKHDAYALAAFIRDALAGNHIRVGASREVWRSYVAIREMMSVVLGLLLRPGISKVFTFDTAGATPIEVGALAAAVRDVIGGTRVERPAIEPIPADWYVGDRREYAAHLKSLGIREVPLDSQIRETAAYLTLA